MQLSRAQITKPQKDSQLKQLFALLGSVSVKAAHKHVDEIEPGTIFGGEKVKERTAVFYLSELVSRSSPLEGILSVLLFRSAVCVK